MHWMEYLSRFDFDIQYVKGVSNKVADSLSRYYQSDTWKDVHPSYDYVNADSQLDPEGEDLPWNRVVEIRAIGVSTRQRPLREATEERDTLAENLANVPRSSKRPDGSEDDEDPTIFDSISEGPELKKHVEKASDFLDRVRQGYTKDILFSKIIKEKERHSSFTYRDGLFYSKNRGGLEVLCVPRVVTKDYSLMATVIEQAPRRRWTISNVGTGGLDLVSRWKSTATCAVFAKQTRQVHKSRLAYSTCSPFPIDCGDQ